MSVKIQPGKYIIQGSFPDDFDQQRAAKLAFAFSRTQPKGIFIIAQDAGQNSHELHYQIAQGLTAAKREIHSIGIAPVESINFSAGAGIYAGGIMITSADTPHDENQIRFIDQNGHFVDPALFENQIPTEKDIFKAIKPNIFEEEYLHAYSSRIKRIVGETIKCRQIRLFIDFTNGSMARAFQRTLKSACPFVKLIAQTNATTDSSLDPKHDIFDDKTCQELKEGVLRHEAELGIIFNHDGTALRICDEKGNMLDNEETVGIIFRELLDRQPGHPVVIGGDICEPIKMSLEELGGYIICEDDDEKKVTERTKTENAIGGYFNNGRFIFHDFFNSISGSLTGCYALCGFARFASQPSTIVERLKETD